MRVEGSVLIQDYEPPEPVYDDIYKKFSTVVRVSTELMDAMHPSVSAIIEPDTLGDVNSLVSLVRNERDGSRTRLKTALFPYRPGMPVHLGHGRSEHDKDDSFWLWRPFSDIWYLTIDGRRILEAGGNENRPPLPPPPPKPWRQRASSAVRQRGRSAADAIAKRLGYHRDGHCDYDD